MRQRFGPYSLDPESRQLFRGSEVVHLSPKAFELLSILLTHRPKALSKSDLQERLWPDTFVVEKNLANLVGEIRDAIGDDPSSPQFIRTVHRFGYAFCELQPGAEATAVANRAGQATFQLKWATGRARLGQGEHVLGRDPDAAVFLDSPGVSRRHAVIKIAADGATIEDLGSKNGTFVGDWQVADVTSLGDGDVIGVGPEKLTLRVFQAPASTLTRETP